MPEPTHERGDILDALDYPAEIEAVMQTYHELRHEWERTREAFRIVVEAVEKREALARLNGEKPW